MASTLTHAINAATAAPHHLLQAVVSLFFHFNVSQPHPHRAFVGALDASLKFSSDSKGIIVLPPVAAATDSQLGIDVYNTLVTSKRLHTSKGKPLTVKLQYYKDSSKRAVSGKLPAALLLSGLRSGEQRKINYKLLEK
eukprot:1989477-Rhodomonas_salina.1